MTYLLFQMLLCLLIAFILGLILGWLFCKIWGCNSDSKSCCGSDSADDDMALAPPFVDTEDNDDVDLDTSVDLDSDIYDIETLEGIGPQTGDLFRGYGISSVGGYLRKLNTPEKREQAAKDLEILLKPLNNWASMSDLLRVEGIDHQYAELTHATGIDTVADLADSYAETLVSNMIEVNNAGKQLIAPTTPSVEEVASWIDQAKDMARVVLV